MSMTTDPNDPQLTRGVDDVQVEQSEKYLVLSNEERARGFVRPIREVYIHVGLKPKNPLRPLTDEEKTRYGKFDYVAFEKYPDSESPVTGRFWTQKQLDERACNEETRMALAIAETYARNPKFYGSTYCVHCRKHRPVEEFVWFDGTVVGS